MSLNQSRIDLYTFMQENWETTEIVYGPLDKRGDSLWKGDNPWIYLDVSWNQKSQQKSMSSRNVKWVTPGIFSIRVFSKASDGEAAIYELIDSILAIFKNKAISNMTFTRFSPSKVVENDSGWLVCTINLSFQMTTENDLQV